MTHNSEDNSIPKRSSQENADDINRRSSAVPIEDGHSSTNNVKRHSNDQSSDKDEMRMKRQVGLFSGVALIVGTMIGSGIFVSAGSLLANAGSPGLCLVLWGVCGVYSLLGAIAYCEIGTLIPKSGGEYIYFLEAFGPLHKFFGPILAFIFAWVTVFLINPSSVAILSLSFAKYLSSPILTAVNFCQDDYLSYVLDRLLATICIGAITFVNCYSVKGATQVQNIFTIGKLTAIAIIIGGGLYYLSLGYTENLEIGFEGSATSFGQIATAFYGGLWAYSGWNNLNFITEELRNPYRTGEMQCWAPPWFLLLVQQTERCLLQEVGREGHSPDFLSYIHIEKKTPVAPILLTSLLGILMIIPGDIASLIDFFGFAISIFYCAAMVALIVMRYTKKDEHRPIKVPIIIPVIVMVVSAILVIAPIAVAPQVQYFYVLLFIFAGLIFYVPFVYYKKTVPGINSFTIFLQKLLEIVPTVSHES
uniref:B(0,+)-type amino acid transporter 1 n=1 Tax=Daphnia galeata TaxID=27404 RepID=A0A8J2WR65_9CRUS|nr:unnamed protein product [Daphnia galeata]